VTQTEAMASTVGSPLHMRWGTRSSDTQPNGPGLAGRFSCWTCGARNHLESDTPGGMLKASNTEWERCMSTS